MKLTGVTLTGVDGTAIDNYLQELKDFSKENTDVLELGILLHRDLQNTSRYPPLSKVNKLVDNSYQKFSLHLCGEWIKDLYNQDCPFKAWFRYPNPFSRIQLNVGWQNWKLNNNYIIENRIDENVNTIKFFNYLKDTFDIKTQFIVQTRDMNSNFATAGRFCGLDFVDLYDISAGNGIDTDFSKLSIHHNNLVGFAGGLNPDNLKQKLDQILSLPYKNKFWIDMETGVRDKKNHFDINKAQKVVDIVKEYMKNAS